MSPVWVVLFFYSTLRTSVNISSNIPRIEASTLAKTELTSVEFPPKISFVGNDAFFQSRLTSAVIPDGVIIGDYSFAQTPITSLVLLNSLI